MMDKFSPRKTKRDGPEAAIQERVIKKLTLLGWYVVVLHGNIYQFGMPDLFCTHVKYGIRLVEIKNPKNYSFTGGQLSVFHKLVANGCGVWILIDDTDEEVAKLFKAPNYWHYLSIMK